MNARNRNLLFAGLMLVAFAAAGYKILKHPAGSGSGFAVAVAKTELPTFKPALQAPQFDAQFVSSNPGQAVHAPSIVELRDGGLRAVWFSGSREGAGDVTIQTAIMNVATGQWGAEATLFSRPQLQRSLQRYIKKIGNPVIARASDGSLHLWMVNVSLGGWAGSAITWSWSEDDGASWSQPKRLVTSPFLNISTLVKGAPVAMTNGQISLPVYHEFVTKFAEVLRLGQDGKVIDKVRIPASQTSLQPVVLANSAQFAQAFMRAGRGGQVMTSQTQDAGRTWSDAASLPIPNPDSALAGITLQNGESWLALNPTQAGREKLALVSANQPSLSVAVEPLSPQQSQARPLSIKDHEAALSVELKAKGVSDSDIKAYVASARKQLCGEANCVQEFSYPFLLQSRDGMLHLVYTWNRSRIKYMRFDPSALPTSASSAAKANGSN